MGSHTAAYRYLAAYCRWLGIAPVGPSQAHGAEGLPGQIDVSDDDIDVTKPVELVVLVVKERAARCRRPGSNKIITLKAADSWSTAPGSIVLVEPNKYWHFKGHPYLSGRIVSSRADAEALGLPSLAVNDVGMWDPTGIYRSDERMGDLCEGDDTGADDEVSTNGRFDAVMARGARPMFEMQQVLPGFDPDDPDAYESDPIIEANELRELQEFGAAQQLLSDLLEADLRCLDAHAHLGNMAFDRFRADIGTEPDGRARCAFHAAGRQGTQTLCRRAGRHRVRVSRCMLCLIGAANCRLPAPRCD